VHVSSVYELLSLPQVGVETILITGLLLRSSKSSTHLCDASRNLDDGSLHRRAAVVDSANGGPHRSVGRSAAGSMQDSDVPSDRSAPQDMFVDPGHQDEASSRKHDPPRHHERHHVSAARITQHAGELGGNVSRNVAH
jgi:hypothetical protein